MLGSGLPIGALTGIELIAAIVVGTLIALVLMWMAISRLLAQLAGWRRLAARYASADPAPDPCQTRVWGIMGLTRYKFAMKVGIESDSLYLDVSALFRVGHRPLRIPWDQVSYEGPGRARVEAPISLLLGPDQIRLVVPAAVVAGRPPGTLDGFEG